MDDVTLRQAQPVDSAFAYAVKRAAFRDYVAQDEHIQAARALDVTLYVGEDRSEAECRTRAFRTSYYAIDMSKLMDLMRQAGFEDIQRIDGRFFQPAITGRKPVVGATSERGHG